MTKVYDITTLAKKSVISKKTALVVGAAFAVAVAIGVIQQTVTNDEAGVETTTES